MCPIPRARDSCRNQDQPQVPFLGDLGLIRTQSGGYPPIRPQHQGRGGYRFYAYLARNGFPNDPPLQVLCVYCNQHKGQCDHDNRGSTKKAKDDSLRLATQQAYGDSNGGCVLCHGQGLLGTNLVLDHTDNDGAAHRKAMIDAGKLNSSVGGLGFYRSLRAQGWLTTPRLRVLCNDCHNETQRQRNWQ